MPWEYLTPESISLLEQELCAIEDDHPDAVIVLRVQNGFSKGLDPKLYGANPQSDPYELRRAEQLLRHFEKLPNFKIAIIEGESCGFGSTFALCCDIRLMHTEAGLRWDELSHGLNPGMAAWRLPQYIGMGRAQDLLMTCRRIDADLACQWGLSTYTFSTESELQELLEQIKQRTDSLSRSGLSATRKLLREYWNASYENALGPCLAAQAMCLQQKP